MSKVYSREDLLIALGLSVLSDELDTDKPSMDLSRTPLSGAAPTARQFKLLPNPDTALRLAMEKLCEGNWVSPRDFNDIIVPLRQSLHPYTLLCQGFTVMHQPHIAA